MGKEEGGMEGSQSKGDRRSGRSFASSHSRTALLLVMVVLLVGMFDDAPLPTAAFFERVFRRWRNRAPSEAEAPRPRQVWLVMSIQRRRWYGGFFGNVVYKIHEDKELPVPTHTILRMNCPAYRVKRNGRASDFEATKRNVQKCRNAATKFAQKHHFGAVAKQTFEVEERNASQLVKIETISVDQHPHFKQKDTVAGDLAASASLFFTCLKPGGWDKESSECYGGQAIKKFYPALEGQYHVQQRTLPIDAMESYLNEHGLVVVTTDDGDTVRTVLAKAESDAAQATTGNSGFEKGGLSTGTSGMVLSAERVGGIKQLSPFQAIERRTLTKNPQILALFLARKPSGRWKRDREAKREKLLEGGMLTTVWCAYAQDAEAARQCFQEAKQSIPDLTHVYFVGIMYNVLLDLFDHFKRSGDRGVAYRYIHDQPIVAHEALTAPVSTALWTSYPVAEWGLVYRATAFMTNKREAEPLGIGNFSLSFPREAWRITDVQPASPLPEWPEAAESASVNFDGKGATVEFYSAERQELQMVPLDGLQSITLERINGTKETSGNENAPIQDLSWNFVIPSFSNFLQRRLFAPTDCVKLVASVLSSDRDSIRTTTLFQMPHFEEVTTLVT